MQHQENVAKWKDECEKIKERNKIRQNKNEYINKEEQNKIDESNKKINAYNEMGKLISSYALKIYCPLDIEIELDSKDVIVFYDSVYKSLADITLTQKLLKDINKIFLPEVKKVKKVSEGVTTFAIEGEWGYVSLDGEYLGYLDVEVIPKFEPALFIPKKLLKFKSKKIELEKLPSKPEKSEIKLYHHKPLPTKPIETFVAVPSEETGMTKFKFGKW